MPQKSYGAIQINFSQTNGRILVDTAAVLQNGTQLCYCFPGARLCFLGAPSKAAMLLFRFENGNP